MFVIEDDLHAEQQDGQFASFEDAIEELERRARIPWDEEPNQAPCSNWRNCGRKYVVIECDTSRLPWNELSRTEVLDVSADGVTWRLGRP